jgi:hypothetical protein
MKDEIRKQKSEGRRMKKINGQNRLGALAGIIAPVLFVGVFLLEGWLRPSYDGMTQYVSELSLGPRGWIQIANFMITGLLLLLFAFSVRAEFKEGKASRFGWILLAISALALLFSGPLVMDTASTPRDQWTLHGILHQLIGALGFFTLAPVICFVFWRRFREDKKWQSLSPWTITATAIILVAIILLRMVPVPPDAANGYTPYAGLIQRTVIITYMVWTFSFALKLFRERV